MGFITNNNFELVLANDIDNDTTKAYKLNHPDVPIADCDISHIVLDRVSNKLKLPVDIVVGGPPCQSYSTLGKRENDERANLFKEFVGVIGLLQPKIFIYENVTGLISMIGGKFFDNIKTQLSNLGYNQNKF